MAVLTITDKHNDTRHYEIHDFCLLGQDPKCQIVLPDLLTSKKHAAIIQKDNDDYIIIDLSSMTGTYVNGVRVASKTLNPNDIISINDYTIQFTKGLIPENEPVEVIFDKSDHVESVNAIDVSRHSFTKVFSRETDASRIRKLLAHLEVIYEISNTVSSLMELEDLLKTILLHLLRVFPIADHCCILLFEEDSTTARLKVSHTREGAKEMAIRISQALLDEVIKNKQALLSTDCIYPDCQTTKQTSDEDKKLHSLLIVPLFCREKFVGMIYLNSFEAACVFTNDDLELLTGISNQIAVAVVNARMHDYMLKQQRIQLDLNYARRIQKSFLPTDLPKLSSYDFNYFYKPAYDVGGDFYDFIPVSDRKIAIIIGDVSGKGVSAALLMARATSELRIAAYTLIEPANVLFHMNRLISNTFQDDCFITLLYTVLDIRCHELQIGNAGHLPLLLKRNNAVIELGKADNIVLGLIPNAAFVQQKITLEKGDHLFYFTDGITEARNKDRDLFGMDRIGEAFLQYQHQPNAKPDFCSLLTERLFKFLKGQPYRSDDITMVELLKLH
jgi:serine phosphatase RsbU (regulator of sigma subunit)